MWNLRRVKVSRTTLLLMIICLELYRIYNNLMDDPDPELVTIPLRQVMSGELLKQDDERIIKYIWKRGLLEPPSKLPYNLSFPNGGDMRVQPPMFVIRTVLRELNITDGFFVECGAFDGEYISNSLYLEKKLGWKGLLIEGNPFHYETLKSKNRKAWLSNTCLSIHPYPHHARFLLKTNDIGRILDPTSPNVTDEKEMEIQCVPLFTLLSALKVSTVDYFSLDVEGSEYEVLKTIPFDKVFIKTLTVEYAHSPAEKQILEFMKNKGYVEIGKDKFPKTWLNDYLFVHEKLINLRNQTNQWID